MADEWHGARVVSVLREYQAELEALARVIRRGALGGELTDADRANYAALAEKSGRVKAAIAWVKREVP